MLLFRTNVQNGGSIMEEQVALEQALALVKKSKIAMIGNNDELGFPNIKAMLNLKTDGLKKVWFSTNTSSKRVAQLKDNNKACVYYMDSENFMGLMLVGTIEVLQDEESRQMMWFDGSEMYYPLGINDPDYSVLCFTATRGNFYHGLKNINFTVISDNVIECS